MTDHAARVREAVDGVLMAYRLSHQLDDIDNGYLLVDALTPAGDETIERGQKEVEYLADAIVDGIVPLIAAAEAKGRAEAVAEAVRIVEVQRTTHGAHNCTLCANDLACYDAAVDYVHNAVLDTIIASLQRQGET